MKCLGEQVEKEEDGVNKVLLPVLLHLLQSFPCSCNR